MMREFKNISKLDKEIVHRLIDKITVGNKYVREGLRNRILLFTINLSVRVFDFSNVN